MPEAREQVAEMLEKLADGEQVKLSDSPSTTSSPDVQAQAEELRTIASDLRSDTDSGIHRQGQVPGQQI